MLQNTSAPNVSNVNAKCKMTKVVDLSHFFKYKGIDLKILFLYRRLHVPTAENLSDEYKTPIN